MLFRDIACLLTDVKVGTPYTERTEVFVDVKSVARSEFYASLQTGTPLTIAFSLRVSDFKMADVTLQSGKRFQPTRIEYDGRVYTIRRTYSKDGEILELNCSGPE